MPSNKTSTRTENGFHHTTELLLLPSYGHKKVKDNRELFMNIKQFCNKLGLINIKLVMCY